MLPLDQAFCEPVSHACSPCSQCGSFDSAGVPATAGGLNTMIYSHARFALQPVQELAGVPASAGGLNTIIYSRAHSHCSQCGSVDPVVSLRLQAALTP